MFQSLCERVWTKVSHVSIEERQSLEKVDCSNSTGWLHPNKYLILGTISTISVWLSITSSEEICLSKERCLSKSIPQKNPHCLRIKRGIKFWDYSTEKGRLKPWNKMWIGRKTQLMPSPLDMTDGRYDCATLESIKNQLMNEEKIPRVGGTMRRWKISL